MVLNFSSISLVFQKHIRKCTTNIEEMLLLQNFPICYSIYVSSLLDQSSSNFAECTVVFSVRFYYSNFFSLSTGYIVCCQILVSEIPVAFICITSFLKTKLVARMNYFN